MRCCRTSQAVAYTQAQEINLAAMGFKPGTVQDVRASTGTSSRDRQGQHHERAVDAFAAALPSPAFFLFRAAQKAAEAANWATLSARGGVVLKTARCICRPWPIRPRCVTRQALVQQDQLVFEHARASQDAGVGINLDVLRAQVELQNEQQQLVSGAERRAKDKIQLNRVMGQPAGQELELDRSPCPSRDSKPMPLDEALEIAYERRKDLRGLEAQLEVAAEGRSRPSSYERLPTPRRWRLLRGAGRDHRALSRGLCRGGQAQHPGLSGSHAARPEGSRRRPDDRRCSSRSTARRARSKATSARACWMCNPPRNW